MDKAMTPERAAQHLHSKGVTAEQVERLRSLPSLNWGLFIKFVEDHGADIAGAVTDFLAIFGK